MTKDNGNWLSAEQAVLPDGTERENLSLINKKLPALAPLTDDSAPESVGQADGKSDDAG
jgi:hypothetical protein